PRRGTFQILQRLPVTRRRSRFSTPPERVADGILASSAPRLGCAAQPGPARWFPSRSRVPRRGLPRLRRAAAGALPADRRARSAQTHPGRAGGGVAARPQLRIAPTGRSPGRADRAWQPFGALLPARVGAGRARLRAAELREN